MNEVLLNTIIKYCCINILVLFTNERMIPKQINKRNLIILTIISTCLLGIFTPIICKLDNLLNIILMYSAQLIIIRISSRNNEYNLMLTNLMANALVYLAFAISTIIEFQIAMILKIYSIGINVCLVFLITAIVLKLFFKIKRFQKGFCFFNNSTNSEMINTIMLNISALIILVYYISGNYYGNLTKQIVICFLVLGVVLFIMIKRTFNIFYKQRLLERNIEDYKSEIALKDAQIKSLSDEKYKISKLNHEFYNRQKALIHKVEEITSMNTEIADELDLSKQINDLTKEYTDKAQEIKTLDKLPTTGIVEIDDMFKYMQSECDSKKIQFNLKINGNIYHMINNKIPQSRLVTLIGDHLRDAIIAIDFSNNTFKSILAVLGENSGVYEFCVFDTGIEFKIDTLLNLGLKPATTHKDSGGTGIGFMTTFETMKETKASLIIDEMREMSNTDYTKSVTIRFDGKNEYRIKSYRSDEIKKKMKDNRIIIENKKGSSTQWN